MGARVINLSLAGLRDLLDPRRDTYSPLEAVRHPVRRQQEGARRRRGRELRPGAAVTLELRRLPGRATARRRRERARLDRERPRVLRPRHAVQRHLGSRLGHLLDASVRRDQADDSACVEQGYSDCGPFEFRRAEGTSFSAPMVAAAAALVLGFATAVWRRSGRLHPRALGPGHERDQRLPRLSARARPAERIWPRRRRGGGWRGHRRRLHPR